MFGVDEPIQITEEIVKKIVKNDLSDSEEKSIIVRRQDAGTGDTQASIDEHIKKNPDPDFSFREGYHENAEHLLKCAKALCEEPYVEHILSLKDKTKIKRLKSAISKIEHAFYGKEKELVNDPTFKQVKRIHINLIEQLVFLFAEQSKIVDKKEGQERKEAEKYKKVRKALFEFTTMQMIGKKRKSICTVVPCKKEGGTDYTVIQVTEPVTGLTDDQIREYLKICNKDTQPKWFKKLSDVKKVYLFFKVEDLLKGKVYPVGNEITRDLRYAFNKAFRTIPSTVKGIPGIQNACIDKVYIVENGEVKHSLSIPRSAGPVCDMKGKKERERLTKQNFAQLYEMHESKRSDQFEKRWGVKLKDKQKSLIDSSGETPKFAKEQVLSDHFCLQSYVSPTRFFPKWLPFGHSYTPTDNRFVRTLDKCSSSDCKILIDSKWKSFYVGYRTVNWAHKFPFSVILRRYSRLDKLFARELLTDVQKFINMISAACPDYDLLNGTYVSDLYCAINGQPFNKNTRELLLVKFRQLQKKPVDENLKKFLNTPEKQNDFALLLNAVCDYLELFDVRRSPLKADRHRRLFKASLEAIIADQVSALFDVFCLHGKDRTSQATQHANAMVEYYYLNNGKLPKFSGEESNKRKEFVEIYTRHLLFSGHPQFMTGTYITKGAFGLKYLSKNLPRDAKKLGKKGKGNKKRLKHNFKLAALNGGLKKGKVRKKNKKFVKAEWVKVEKEIIEPLPGYNDMSYTRINSRCPDNKSPTVKYRLIEKATQHKIVATVALSCGCAIFPLAPVFLYGMYRVHRKKEKDVPVVAVPAVPPPPYVQSRVPN